LIQAAIIAAVNGVDQVLVHDGVYAERINFKGKAITVRSVNGPDVTIIDGGKKGSVVVFNSGEERDSLLEGFTIKNGHAANGGGILFNVHSASTIINCTVSDNKASGECGGFYCTWYSSPTVVDSVLLGDTASVADDEVHLGLVASINITDTDLSNDDMETIIPQENKGYTEY
jgi:hypothetical protein